VQKAVPVVALERDKTRSPIRELLEFANQVFSSLMGSQEPEPAEEPREKERKQGVFSSRINR
jgi:hypothetical protein